MSVEPSLDWGQIYTYLAGLRESDPEKFAAELARLQREHGGTVFEQGENGLSQAAGSPNGQHPSPDPNHPFATLPRLWEGRAWLTSDSPDPEAVWGDGAEVWWSHGEPCIVTGPIGSGKTTLLGRLVHASLGCSGDVLGYSVTEIEGGERILYLACDRPRQIKRNLRRMFEDKDWTKVQDRLVVWDGAPAVDLARNPGALLMLSLQVNASRVFVDGIKDVAADLSEEATGQGLNKAFQALVAAGVDVVANHHQRKREGSTGAKKPKSLDDVYGSTWLAAGAGTVILCWVDASGSTEIEFSTLKAAAEPVGPIVVEYNLDRGTFEVEPEGAGPERITLANVSRVLTEQRHRSLTGTEMAIALGYREPEKYVVQRCRQQAEKLVASGHVQVTEFQAPTGGSPEKFYRWISAEGREQ